MLTRSQAKILEMKSVKNSLKVKKSCLKKLEGSSSKLHKSISWVHCVGLKRAFLGTEVDEPITSIIVISRVICQAKHCRDIICEECPLYCDAHKYLLQKKIVFSI